MRRELIAYEDPKSHVSELFRTLRTNVQFINASNKLPLENQMKESLGYHQTWL